MNVAVRSEPARESWGERLGTQARRIAANADARAIAGLTIVFVRPRGAQLAGMGLAFGRRRPRA